VQYDEILEERSGRHVIEPQYTTLTDSTFYTVISAKKTLAPRTVQRNGGYQGGSGIPCYGTSRYRTANAKACNREVSRSSSIQTMSRILSMTDLLAAVPRLRRLVAAFLPRKPGIAAASVHMGFVVDKQALGQAFLRVIRFSSANTIPP
jgi:hypothetical protein